MTATAGSTAATGHAAELFIGAAAVKKHVARLFSKLEAHDRARFVIVAYESALVTPSR